MKHATIRATLAAVWFVAGPSFAGPTNAVPLRLAVEFADGSRLIGIPSADTLRVQAPYAKVDLPFKLLSRIRLLDDRENVRLEFANGDRLAGIPDMSALSLRTLFGQVRLPPAEVRAITILPASDEDALMLYYSFDADPEGRVLDGSGQGNHGCPVGPVAREDGVSGRAVRFGSKDTYLVCAAPGLNMNDWEQMTVSLWTKVVRHTTYGHVISRGPVEADGLGAFWLAIGSSYGKGHFGMLTAGAEERGIPDPWNRDAPSDWGRNPPPGQWHHLALVYDGAALRYYIDGAPAREAAAPRPGAALRDRPDSKLVIGTVSQHGYMAWGDMYFDGCVDEVRIYRRALAGEEVRRLAAR